MIYSEVVNDHPKYGYEEGNDYKKILYSQYFNSRFVLFKFDSVAIFGQFFCYLLTLNQLK